MHPDAAKFESQLRDALYTAVGASVLAYRFSKPYREQAKTFVEGLCSKPRG